MAPATTLHAVLVGDTNDSKIGSSVKVDLENLKTQVQSIAQNTNLSVPSINPLQVGKPGDYDQVVQAIQNLSVGDQDVVFFYYSGHGGRQPLKESPWPALFVEGPTNSKMLSLDQVIDTLQQKKPRLLIVIADSCNVMVALEKRAEEKEPEEAEKYKKLFLGYRGSIIASSSIPEQPSYGDSEKGGVYTGAFLRSLHKQVDASLSEEPSWQKLMTNAANPHTVTFYEIPKNPQSRKKDETQQPQTPLVDITTIDSIQLKEPQSSSIGFCSQNQYGPHPTDPSKKCCMDDDNEHRICVRK